MNCEVWAINLPPAHSDKTATNRFSAILTATEWATLQFIVRKTAFGIFSKAQTIRMSLLLSVFRVTDRAPPITGLLQVAANTDPALYDVLGRRFFATITAHPF